MTKLQATNRMLVTVAGMVTFGTTTVSVVLGAHHIAYLTTIALATVLAVGALTMRSAVEKRSYMMAALLLGALFISFVSQQLFGSSIKYSSPQFLQSLTATVAMAGVVTTTFAVSMLGADHFRRAAGFLSMLCGLTLAYGAVIGGALEVEVQTMRFSSEQIGTAAWSEIALGTILLCLLAERRYFGTAIIAFGFFVIFIAQMRTAGIAAALAIMVYASLSLGSKLSRKIGSGNLLASLVVLSGLLVVFLPETKDALYQLLLLDDEHRGIGSGFSGRLENFKAGLMIADANLLFGIGPLDPVAGYTHNGYIKILAQFGLTFSIPFFVFLALSVWAAVRLRSPRLIACTVALVFFYIGQPRHLNFQLMPFVGLIACAIAFTEHFDRKRISSAKSPQPTCSRKNTLHG